MDPEIHPVGMAEMEVTLSLRRVGLEVMEEGDRELGLVRHHQQYKILTSRLKV